MRAQRAFVARVRRRATLLCIGLLLAPGAAPLAALVRESEQHGDMDVSVSLDESAQSGRAQASEFIGAAPEIIAALIRSCPETLKIVPGLVECRVLESAPDGSWQIVRQVEEHWLLPRLTYELRCTWESPTRVHIQRVGGDLRVLDGTWQLEPEHEGTRVHYDVEIAPGFWVPRFMVKLFLRHDLPRMLRALRARAEEIAAGERNGATPGRP